MPTIVPLLILVTVICSGNGGSAFDNGVESIKNIMDWVIPAKSFSTRQSFKARSLDREYLNKELGYYRHMKDVGFYHTFGALITTPVLVFVMGGVGTTLSPIAIGWGAYHFYMTDKSKHIENQLIEGFDLLEDRYIGLHESGPSIWRRCNRFGLRVITNPLTFCIMLYALVGVFIYQKYVDYNGGVNRYKLTLLELIVTILVLLYLFSFLQEVVKSNITMSERGARFEERVEYECNINTMKYSSLIKKKLGSMLQLDMNSHGYLIGDKTCDHYYLQLLVVEMGESVLKIFFRSLVVPPYDVIMEMFQAIPFWNKVWLGLWSIGVLICALIWINDIVKYWIRRGRRRTVEVDDSSPTKLNKKS